MPQEPHVVRGYIRVTIQGSFPGSLPERIGGDYMLSFIYRLVSEFEREHGIHPNLLYLNDKHAEYLQQSFSNGFRLHSIMKFLQMELIIDKSIAHPHVAWTHTAQRFAS